MTLQKEMALPEPEIIQIQVSSAKKAGPYHLMQGQNPVYIVSFYLLKQGSICQNLL